MITIIDYDRGNLYSLSQAFKAEGIEYEMAETAASIARARILVLPGVGAFGDARRTIDERGMLGPITEHIATGKPFLGICLGMQMLAEASEEFGLHPGFGIVKGRVLPLPKNPTSENAVRIPNVGWRSIRPRVDDPVLGAASTCHQYYFVHSYGVVPDDHSLVAALAVNGSSFAAAVRTENAYGVQFHPEKSGPVGLAMLQRFHQFAMANG